MRQPRKVGKEETETSRQPRKVGKEETETSRKPSSYKQKNQRANRNRVKSARKNPKATPTSVLTSGMTPPQNLLQRLTARWTRLPWHRVTRFVRVASGEAFKQHVSIRAQTKREENRSAWNKDKRTKGLALFSQRQGTHKSVGEVSVVHGEQRTRAHGQVHAERRFMQKVVAVGRERWALLGWLTEKEQVQAQNPAHELAELHTHTYTHIYIYIYIYIYKTSIYVSVATHSIHGDVCGIHTGRCRQSRRRARREGQSRCRCSCSSCGPVRR
jgi:hypothetical protein